MFCDLQHRVGQVSRGVLHPLRGSRCVIFRVSEGEYRQKVLRDDKTPSLTTETKPAPEGPMRLSFEGANALYYGRFRIRFGPRTTFTENQISLGGW
jgi:hypothetical protein